MWLTFDKIDVNILIDCRNFANNKDIMPTYKLAKKLGILKKLVFHIDSVFFAFYFINKLSYFKDGANVLIYNNEKRFYLSDKKVDNSFKVLDIVFKDKKIHKVINNLEILKFKEGYIIIEK